MSQIPGKNGDAERDAAALRLVQRFQKALQQDDRATVVEALRELVALCAPMAGQWLQLAPMAADFGEFGLAREAIDLFVESAGGGPADFVVELESRADGRKEIVGVQLVDVLEFHGLVLADWEGSDRQEQEALIEEVALWSKRSAGDLGSYFSQVVSGFDGEEEGAEVPR